MNTKTIVAHCNFTFLWNSLYEQDPAGQLKSKIGNQLITRLTTKPGSSNMAALSAEQIQQMIDEKIHSKKVVIFSKSQCPYCIKAKNVFSKYKQYIPDDQYEVMELDDVPQMHEIQMYLKTITGASSVPRVFINGKCIGGGDDTVRLHETNQLLAKLQ